MRYGERCGYSAIEWSTAWDPSLRDLIGVAPELVVGQRVAITSCDSGSFRPSAQDLTSGWQCCESTAISKEISSPSDLPTPGFDEWYVFARPPLVVPLRNHVNRYGFSVFDECDEADSFWEQVKESEPLHVLGAGTPNMFLVTRDKAIFDRVKKLYVSR
ncbi:MAG: hypothetical protein ACXU8N_21180 [Telluria sp.]